jgi:hypothetical protein
LKNSTLRCVLVSGNGIPGAWPIYAIHLKTKVFATFAQSVKRNLDLGDMVTRGAFDNVSLVIYKAGFEVLIEQRHSEELTYKRQFSSPYL